MDHTMRTLFAAAILTLAGGLLQAQNVPFLAPGNVELNGFVGAGGGAGTTSVGVGGNVAVAVNRYVMPYAEYSYYPSGLGGSTLVVPNPIGGTNDTATTRGEASRQDIHGGVHLRIPRGSSKIVPYVAFGAGALQFGLFTGTTTIPVGTGVTRTFPQTAPSTAEFALNYGGGIRIYTKENFGMRIEAKGYTPVTGNYVRETFLKATFGLFWYSRK